MHLTHQQEEFSRAFVHAVVSAAGFKVQPGATPDDESVDLTIASQAVGGRLRSPRLDVQLKCHMGPVSGDPFSFPLKLKNYEDLSPPVTEFLVPRVLILVLVPEDVSAWATHTPESLILQHCAYWVCLHGWPPTSNETSVTIHIPRANTFTKDALTAMMGRVANGGQP